MKFIASLPFYNFHVLHVKLFLCVRSEGTLSVLWQIEVRQQEKSLLFLLLLIFIILRNLSLYMYNCKYIPLYKEDVIICL